MGLRSRRAGYLPRLVRRHAPPAASAPMKPAIVTIGNFDGVHLGHRKLVGQVVDRARSLGLRSFAVTFDPHPERVLFPEGKLTSLSTAEERRQILCESGIDDVWVCPFTTDLARLEPEEFMQIGRASCREGGGVEVGGGTVS